MNRALILRRMIFLLLLLCTIVFVSCHFDTEQSKNLTWETLQEFESQQTAEDTKSTPSNSEASSLDMKSTWLPVEEDTETGFGPFVPIGGK